LLRRVQVDHQLGGENLKLIRFSVGPSSLHGDVLPFGVAVFPKTLPECIAEDKNPIRNFVFGCCASTGKQSAKSKAPSAKKKTLSAVLFLTSDL
jgi:hypothetical protein